MNNIFVLSFFMLNVVVMVKSVFGGSLGVLVVQGPRGPGVSGQIPIKFLGKIHQTSTLGVQGPLAQWLPQEGPPFLGKIHQISSLELRGTRRTVRPLELTLKPPPRA